MAYVKVAWGICAADGCEGKVNPDPKINTTGYCRACAPTANRAPCKGGCSVQVNLRANDTGYCRSCFSKSRAGTQVAAATDRMVGLPYGRLVVVARVANNRLNEAMFLARCTCPAGTEIVVKGADMRTGNTTSCGCVRSEMMAEFNFHPAKKAVQVDAPLPRRAAILAAAQDHWTTSDDCIQWRGYLDAGYGKHEDVWEAVLGRPVATGMTLDHMCRNTACVNVRHLVEAPNSGAGSNAQRMQDARRIMRDLGGHDPGPEFWLNYFRAKGA